jgi:hypothetical protein
MKLKIVCQSPGGNMSTDQQETDEHATLQPDTLKSSLNIKIIYFRAALKHTACKF